MLELADVAARRPRARAGLRAGRPGARGGRARRARRRGRAHRRRRGDDGDRRRARRRAAAWRNVTPARARPRAHRRARRLLRRRAVPRGADVRARARPRAAREIRARAAPGRPRRGRGLGRRASATRGSGLVMDAVSAQIGAPVPPPGIPGPFALGDAGELRGLLADAGLADVQRRASSPCRCAPRRSTSGGSGRRRSPARCRRSSPSMPEAAVQAHARARPRGRRDLRDRVGRPGLPGRDADRGRPALRTAVRRAAVRGAAGAPSARRAARPPRPRGRWPGGRRCASPAGAR